MSDNEAPENVEGTEESVEEDAETTEDVTEESAEFDSVEETPEFMELTEKFTRFTERHDNALIENAKLRTIAASHGIENIDDELQWVVGNLKVEKGKVVGEPKYRSTQSKPTVKKSVVKKRSKATPETTGRTGFFGEVRKHI